MAAEEKDEKMGLTADTSEQGIADVVDELALDKMRLAHTKVCEAVVALTAAYEAQKLAINRGATTDFSPRIQNLLSQADSLGLDMAEVIPDFLKHKHVTGCTDAGCPVHGKSVFASSLRANHYKCTTEGQAS
jgi:hypothetical protein